MIKFAAETLFRLKLPGVLKRCAHEVRSHVKDEGFHSKHASPLADRLSTCELTLSLSLSLSLSLPKDSMLSAANGPHKMMRLKAEIPAWQLRSTTKLPETVAAKPRNIFQPSCSRIGNYQHLLLNFFRSQASSCPDPTPVYKGAIRSLRPHVAISGASRRRAGVYGCCHMDATVKRRGYVGNVAY